MEGQIIDALKSSDTRKALGFFAERRIKTVGDAEPTWREWTGR